MAYIGMIGKWHLGTANGHHPIHRGFDYYVGLPYSNDMGCGATPTIVMAPQNAEHTELCPTCAMIANGSKCPADPSCGRANGCADSDLGVPLFNNLTIIEQPANLDTVSDRYGLAAETFIADAGASGAPFFLYYAHSHMHVPQNHDPKWDNKTGGFFHTV